MRRTACWSCDGVGCARCPRHPDKEPVYADEAGTDRARWYFGTKDFCEVCGIRDFALSWDGHVMCFKHVRAFAAALTLRATELTCNNCGVSLTQGKWCVSCVCRTCDVTKGDTFDRIDGIWVCIAHGLPKEDQP